MIKTTPATRELRGLAKARTPDPIERLIGPKIKMRRVAQGMSQQALAAKVGVAFQQIQKYENGANRISAGRLYELATALDVPLEYFFENSPPQVPKGQSNGTDDFVDVMTIISSRDGVALNKAFQRVADRRIRRAIIELLEAMECDLEKS